MSGLNRRALMTGGVATLAAGRAFAAAPKATVQGPGAYRYTLIDADDGAILRREQNLMPLFFDQPYYSARRPDMNPDQLYVDADGNLVHWNAVTNERNILIRKKA